MSDLAAVHQLALRLRETGRDRPSELVAAWPRLLRTLRDKAVRAGANDSALTLERMRQAGHAVTRSPEIQPWLENAQPAAAFLELGQAIARAQLGDIGQAPYFLASTSWITGGHVVDRIRDDIADILTRPGMDRKMRPVLAHAAARAKPRIDAAAILGQGSRFAAEAREPFPELDGSIGHWDIAAHRALGDSPTSLVVAFVAYYQRASSKTISDQLHAGLEAGLLTTEEHERIAPAFAQSVQGWKTLDQTVQPMASGRHDVPRTFHEAATQLRESLRSVPIDTTAKQAWRGLITNYFSTNVALAAAVRDAIGDKRVVGLARTIAHQIREHPEWGGPGDGAVVDPRAVHRGTSVPLPDGYRTALLEGTGALVANSVDALKASATLDQGLTGRRTTDAPRSGRPTDRPAPPPAAAPGPEITSG